MPARNFPANHTPVDFADSHESSDGELCVAIFAYNEQESIIPSIESVLAAAENAVAPECVQVIVLVNGCTDETAARVSQFGQRDQRVLLKEIEIGDKANAWNTYVHEVANIDRDDRLHAFMDGDVTCTPGVVAAMMDAIRLAPHVNAVATLPAPGVGRNRQLNVELYEQDGAIFGNLYGLTNQFMRRVRERGIRIPRGAVGEDAVVTEMVAFDLERTNNYNHRLAVCAAEPAGFIYPRLSPLRISDIRLYFNRRIRYSIREQQMPLLQRIEFDNLPESIEPVNREILDAMERRRFLSPLQWFARRRLRKALQP